MMGRRVRVVLVAGLWLGILAVGTWTYPRWGYLPGYHVYDSKVGWPLQPVPVLRKRFSWLPGAEFRPAGTFRVERIGERGPRSIVVFVEAERSPVGREVGRMEFFYDDPPPGVVIIDGRANR